MKNNNLIKRLAFALLFIIGTSFFYSEVMEITAQLSENNHFHIICQVASRSTQTQVSPLSQKISSRTSDLFFANNFCPLLTENICQDIKNITVNSQKPKDLYLEFNSLLI